MKIPLPDFGKHGVVSDTLNTALPMGTWTDARNMRFSGIQMEKMLEPELVADLTDLTGSKIWMQGWGDGLSSYLVVVTREEGVGDKLWFLRQGFADGPVTWQDVSRDDGYSGDGIWDSFSWGDTVIFNNGRQPPQIFNKDQLQFEDMPNWGMISSASDISDNADPSVDTKSYCKIIFPYRNYLIALGVSEYGNYQPNTVWWSDATALATYRTDTQVSNGGPPSWDYESPATLSGKAEVGVGAGAITCACALNENLIIYTEGSATAMQFVGGAFVMQFRRLFNKGAAGQRCAVEFNAQNFVVARDQIYVHDGSVPVLIAKDRVEEEFFVRVGKGGRFGGIDVDWEAVQVVKNPDRKEIYVIYGSNEPVDDGEGPGEECGVLPDVTGTIQATMIWNQLTGTTSSVQAPQGLFGVEGNRIMLANQGDALVVTQNLGDHWTDTGELLPGSSAYATNKFLYNEELGLWYVSRETITTSGHWWSDDNGVTWHQIGPSVQRASTSMAIDPATNNLITAGASTIGHTFVFTDPDQAGGTPSWDNNNATGENFDNLELINGYVVAQRQTDAGVGGNVAQISIMPYGGNQGAFEAALITKYSAQMGDADADFRPWSEVYNDELVMVVRNEGMNVGGATVYSGAEFAIIDPVDMIAAGTSAAAPRLQVDFGESIDMARINSSPNYFVTIARPKNPSSSDKRLILKWGTDPKNPDMSDEIMVELDYIPDLQNTARPFEDLFHIEWAVDHKWVIGFSAHEDHLTKLFLIDLCAAHNV